MLPTDVPSRLFFQRSMRKCHSEYKLWFRGKEVIQGGSVKSEGEKRQEM